MKHIIHKHDTYCIIRCNVIGQKYFMVYLNSDFLDNVYEIQDGVIPEVPGYEETELQVLYDNFNVSRGR